MLTFDDAVSELARRLADGEPSRSTAESLYRRLDKTNLRVVAIGYMEIEARSLMRTTTHAIEIANTHVYLSHQEEIDTAWEVGREEREQQYPGYKRIREADEERGRQQAEAQREVVEAHRRRRLLEEAAAEERVDEAMRRVKEAEEAWKQALRMEWTRELLGAAFALRDGTIVTWGSATVAQHEDRIAMFTDNAVANIEGAARHQAAITELREKGLLCLNELQVLTV